MSTNDKEMRKAVDLIQPGSCYGHWDKTARECKMCFIVEQCSKYTTNKELIEEPEIKKPAPKIKPAVQKHNKKFVAKKEPSTKPKAAPEKKKTGDLLLDLIKDVKEVVSLTETTESEKSIMYYFNNKEMVINYLKATGQMRLTKGESKVVYERLQTKEQANIFKKALLAGYED